MKKQIAPPIYLSPLAKPGAPQANAARTGEDDEVEKLIFQGKNGGYSEINVDLIDPSPYQSKIVNERSEAFITELAANINEEKLTTPIVVRKKDGGRYELIAGEHRLLSFKRNGELVIPAIIKDLDDKSAASAAVLDNVFRKNNSAFELWRGFKILLDMKVFKTQASLASKVNISETEISRIMACDKLPDDLLKIIQIDSHRFGSSTINTFASLVDSHKSLLIEAANKIVHEDYDQGAAIAWVRKKISSLDQGKSNAGPIEILNKEGKAVLKLDVNSKSANIKLTSAMTEDFKEKLIKFLQSEFSM